MKNKKKLKWIIVIFTIITTALSSNGQITKNLSYSFDDIQYITQSKKGHNFEKIKMGKAFQSRAIGKPELPVFYYKFYIKKGETVTGITYENTSIKEFQLKSDIFPAQHPILQSQIGIDTTFDAPIPATYLNNSYYPENNAVIIGSDFIDGDLEILTVAVYPIQYNPVLRKIKITENGVLRIFTSNTIASKPVSFLSSNRFKEHTNTPLMIALVKSLVQNPGDIPILNNSPLEKNSLSDLKSA